MAPMPSKADLLERAAARVATDRRFLASLLADWTGGDLDIARLAHELHCDASGITRLALCFRPRQDPAGFRVDVARIAASVGVSAARLTDFLREAEALAAFRRPAPLDGALLAAARDRIEPGESEPDKN